MKDQFISLFSFFRRMRKCRICGTIEGADYLLEMIYYGEEDYATEELAHWYFCAKHAKAITHKVNKDLISLTYLPHK